MAESTNRFSALELDDDGNIVQRKAPKKQQEPKEEPKQQVQTEQKDRTRVSDRNRRGGRGGAEGGRGGRGRGAHQHRGGYIGDGEKREFDRRGAPNNDRPRGRARKGGVGLGRYDGEETHRRNRPARNEVDPTVEPSEAVAAADASTEAPAAEVTETPAVEEVVAVEPVVEEDPDTSLTYDEYVAQQKAKAVDDDVNRKLRSVEVNDKQWTKVAAVVGKKKKIALNAKGEEVVIEEEERAPVERTEKKKKILSLDEFVGTSPAPAAQSSPSSQSRGGRGGASSEFRGRGRGGASGEFRGRGRGRGGRGGFRGPSVAIDDKNAFPDLSAAKKN